MKRTMLAVILLLFASSLVCAQNSGAASEAEKAGASVGEVIKDVGQSIGNGIKSGAEKAGEFIESKKAVKVTGKLKVSGRDESLVFTIKGEDKVTYTVKPLSKSEDAALKLSGYKNRRITVTGVLDTDKNEITAASYKLASEK